MTITDFNRARPALAQYLNCLLLTVFHRRTDSHHEPRMTNQWRILWVAIILHLAERPDQVPDMRTDQPTRHCT